MNAVLFVVSGGCITQVESALGVYKALDELGIIPAQKSKITARGTSAGAAVNTCLAALRWHPTELVTRLKDFVRAGNRLISRKWFWPLRMFFGEHCIYNRRGLEKLLRDIVGDKTFPEVTNIVTRWPEFTRLELAGSYDSALASTSIQRIFPKTEIEGKKYVDGGYVDNVPIEPFMLQLYKHIIIILPPKDIGAAKRPATFIDKVYRGLNVKLGQEVAETEFIYSQKDKYPQCTVIRPSPFDNHPLCLSKNFALLDHAYQYAMNNPDVRDLRNTVLNEAREEVRNA